MLPIMATFNCVGIVVRYMLDKYSNLPDNVQSRMKELHESGLPKSMAIGRAIYDMEFQSNLSFEEYVNIIGVSEETIRGYKSKADSRIHDSLDLVVQTFGGNRVILASKSSVYYPDHVTYIVSEFYQRSRRIPRPLRSGMNPPT